MNVLVFGAGGYIGIPLTEELARRNHVVTAADRWFFGRYTASGCDITADIRTYHMPAGFDAVIDLCGLSNDASCEIEPTLTDAINRDGGMRLATMAKNRGVRKYIYASSAAVYGNGKRAGLKETDDLKPLTSYATAKARVEEYLREIAGDGFSPIILRNATVFGVAPRMRFDLAVNGMTLRAYKNHEIYVMGGGQQWRPFIHISDVVRVFVEALESDTMSGTFNVGYDALNVRVWELARMVHSAFPYAKIHHIPDGDDLRSYNLSFDKLANTLKSGKACTSISDGMEEVRSAIALNPDLATDPTTMTVAWYRSLIDWEKRLDSLRLNGKVL